MTKFMFHLSILFLVSSNASAYFVQSRNGRFMSSLKSVLETHSSHHVSTTSSTDSWIRNSSQQQNKQKQGTLGGVSMFLDQPGKTTTNNNNNAKVLDTTTIGTTIVPSVGIGTISWSSDSLTSLESLELQSLVDTACRENVAFFDTAERYGSHFKTALGLGWGETELLLRKLLQQRVPSNRNQKTQSLSSSTTKSTTGRAERPPILASKFTPSPWRRTPESVVEACRQSCERLGVDKLDLYQLHMPDIVKPMRSIFGIMADESLDEVYWEGLVQCYKLGLASNVGVSNYGPTLLTKCHTALAKQGVPLASNQIAYSLLGRHNGAQETVDKCHELGIAVLAAFPFAMGLLTGKYTSSSSLSLSSNDSILTSLTSSRKTKLELKDLHRYVTGDDGKTIPRGGITPLLSVMESLAAKHEKSVAQVALNYILCKGVIPIPGARTQAQLLDNMGAMGWRLAKEEVVQLETVADELGFGFDGAGFKRTSEKFVGYGVEKWRLD